MKDLKKVRNKVRTLARLLTKPGEKKEGALSEFLSGPNFKLVVEAVKSLYLEADSPQLALTLDIT